MQTYLRNKPAWLQLIIFGCLTIGILILSLTLGVSIVAHFNNLSPSQVFSMGPADYAKPELSGVIRGILIVQFFGIFFLPPLVFAYLADPHPLAYLGVKSPQKNSFLLLAMVTMLAAYFTVELMATINESIVHILPKSTQQWIESGEDDADGTLKNILSMKNPAELMITLILVGALPAIGEELFFRGVLQKFFIQIFKKAWPGIIFTGFLFSAFHMQFMGFLPRMALGIILGALYWYSGSIFTSMLGHFVFNSINIVLIYYKVIDLDSKSVSNMAFNLIGLGSLAAVVLLLAYLRKRSETKYDTEFPPQTEITIFDDPDHPV
jgi:membrane protease YdiL (CAAX protease family)